MEQTIDFLYNNIDQLISFMKYYIHTHTNPSVFKNYTVSKTDVLPYDPEVFKFKLAENTQTQEHLHAFFSWYKNTVVSMLCQNASEILDSKIDIADPTVKTQFVINVGHNDNTRKLFILCVLLYYTSARTSKKKHYVSIDFEFTQRQIRLCQLSYETPRIKGKYNASFIWVVCPTELTDKMMSIFINYTMTCPKVIKLTQGADSLDIPYVFKEMFNNNPKYITKFSKSAIDMRFLCEYFKAIVKSDKKCSIYDLLLYFGTITQERYDYLEDINFKMGPPQDRVWNLHNLSSFHLKYAYYDVLFLRSCIHNIYTKAKTEIPEFYKSFFYIPQIASFIFVEKQGITTCIATAKQEVDPINNYIIKFHNENMFLVTIFGKFMQDIVIEEINMNINAVMSVNYLKTHMMVLFKKIVYSILLNSYKVLKNKNEYYNGKLSLDNLFSSLKEYGFRRLIKLLLAFYKYAASVLPKLYK